MIDRPELHSHVEFYAKDPDDKRTILLNEEPSISAAVVAGCPEYLDVFVTAEQGRAQKMYYRLILFYKLSFFLFT